MHIRIVRVSLAPALAAMLLAGLWMLLPNVGEAAAKPGVNRPSAFPQPQTPDPRWLALVHAEVAVPQTTTLSINLNLTDGFVAGHVVLPNLVTITVTRAGAQVAQTEVMPVPDSSGFFYLAHPNWDNWQSALLSAGDVVWVTQANATLSMTVPTLSGLAAPEADVVYGTAPISAPLTLYLFPFVAPDLSYTRTLTADAAGQYQASWTPDVDLLPRDTGYVLYAEDADRQAYARYVAPFLRAQVSSLVISGMAAPNSSVAITVADAEDTVLFYLSAYAFADGSFTTGGYYGGLGGGGGTDSLRLQPGYHISTTAAAQTYSMTVLTVTTHADLPNGQVWGEAPAGQPVEVLTVSGPLEAAYDDDLWDETVAAQATITATASGNYTATLPLSRGDYGAAIVSSPEGHQTYARFAVPYLVARLGNANSSQLPYLAWGQADDPAAPITIAVRGPSGYLKGEHYFYVADNGYFVDNTSLYSGSDPITLEGGDFITVTTPRGIQVALALPELTAQADSDTDMISGQAPPNAPLTVMVYDWSLPWFSEIFSGVVTSTAQGSYSLDLNALGGFTKRATGQVLYTTPEGHSVVRGFASLQLCEPSLGAIQVGGNLLNLYSDYFCPPVTLRLRDAQSQIKVEHQISPGYDYALYLTDSTGRPIPVLPGDSVEIETDDGSLLTTAIPTLTAALDASANTVAGQAPTGTELSIQVATPQLGFYYPNTATLTTTADAQGNYAVNLTGFHTLAPGDRARVTYTVGEQTFFADDAVPLAQAYLYQSSVQGWLPPLTPYTVTYTTADSSLTTTVSGYYAGTDGAFGTYVSLMQAGDWLTITTPVHTWQQTLPFLSAHIDRASATVSGQAPAGAQLLVNLFADDSPAATQLVTTTAEGAYTATFSTLTPLHTAWGTLTYSDPDDFQIILDFATPHWEVILGNSCLSGNAEAAGSPITVTLLSGDGTFKGEATTWAFGTNGWYFVCLPATLQPNDHLILAHPTGVTTYTVPNVTAHHDYDLQALTGQALPDTALVATFITSYYPYVVNRHAQADATGHYGMDTSDLALRLGQTGYVVMTDSDGNTVRRDFAIQGHPIYFPLLTK